MRLPNWVGDVCKSLPTLHALREAGFRAHLVLRHSLADLVAGFGWPVVTVGGGIRGPARAVRKIDCDRALLLTTSFGTAAAARLGGVRAVGFRGDYRSWLLHRAVEYPTGEHEVASLWLLGRTAQQTFAPDSVWPESVPERMELPLTGEHHAMAKEALAARDVDEPFTVLCPMAVGRRDGHSKVWPHWSAASHRLADLGRRLVVCPGPGEEDACAAAVPEATLLPGVGLGAYAAICARAEQVLANDSGPLFLAAAVGAPVIGIYGAAVRSEVRPLGADFIGSDEGWPAVDDVLSRLPT